MNFIVLITKIMSTYAVVATLAYLTMVIGLFWRKTRRQWHARAMQTAMFIDLTLVVTLEFKRHAVEKALEFSMPFLQQLHIGTSLTAVLLYAPTFILGRKLLRLEPGAPEHARLRALHMRFAWGAFIFRSLGFILMFSILLGRKP